MTGRNLFLVSVLTLFSVVSVSQGRIYRDSFNRSTEDLHGDPRWVLVHGAVYGYQVIDGSVVSIYHPVVNPGMLNLTGYVGAVHQGQTYQRASIEIKFPKLANDGHSPEFYLNLNWDGGEITHDGHGFGVMSEPSAGVISRSYRLGVRGTRDFNVAKMNSANEAEISTGWTAYDKDTLKANTWYRLTLERDRQTITAAVSTLDGAILGRGQIVDEGQILDGGRVVLQTVFPPSTTARSPSFDNFEYELTNGEQISVVSVKKGNAPAIDGRLDEACWQSGAAVSTLWGPTGVTRKVASSVVRVSGDEENLYVAFDCPFAEGQSAAEAKKLMTDDLISQYTAEVFLDPFLESRRKSGLDEDPEELYYNYRQARIFRFAVNAVNGRHAELMGRPWWQVPWQSATHIDNDRWTAELAIPFASLAFFEPAKEVLRIAESAWTDEWAVNFVYDDACWLPGFGRDNYPLAYGKLTDVNIDANRYRWVVAESVGRQLTDDVYLWWDLGNWTGHHADVKVLVRDWPFNSDPESFDPIEVAQTVPDKRYEKASLSVPIRTPGRHRWLFSILDAKNNRPLVHRPLLLENVAVGTGTWDRSVYMDEEVARLTVKQAKYAKQGRSLRYDLRKEGETDLRQSRRTAWGPDRANGTEFLLTTLPYGRYEVTVTAEGYESHPFRTSFTKAPPKPGTVQYTDAGMLLRDGEPFFPIGFYYVTIAVEEHLAEEYVAAGFNSLCLEWRNAENYVKTLRKLKKWGICPTVSLSVMPEIFDLGPDYRAETMLNKRFPRVRTAVEMIARQAGDNILAWYTVDEGNQSTIPRVQGLHEIIKEVDPYHPSFTVAYLPYIWSHHSATDILGSDVYPGPGGRMRTVADGLEASHATLGDKPVMAILQAFGDPGGDRNAKLPSPAELRCMSYLSLVHRAAGIYYFSWNYNGPMNEAHPEQWAELKKIAGEFRDLGPALLVADAGAIKITAVNEIEQVESRVIQFEDRIILIAVNTERTDARNVQWQITGVADSDHAVLWEDRTVNITDGRLSDNFEPLTVHVYNLKNAAGN